MSFGFKVVASSRRFATWRVGKLAGSVIPIITVVSS